MASRREKRRITRQPDPLEGAIRTMTVKVIASLDHAEHAAWLTCFSMALGGLMSRPPAERKGAIREAAEKADKSIIEARARKHIAPASPVEQVQSPSVATFTTTP